MIDLPFEIKDLRSHIPSVELGRHGWTYVGVPTVAEYCPYKLVIAEKKTGKPVEMLKPCSSWLHDSCALDKAVEHIRWLIDRFGDFDRVWVARRDDIARYWAANFPNS